MIHIKPHAHKGFRLLASCIFILTIFLNALISNSLEAKAFQSNKKTSSANDSIPPEEVITAIPISLVIGEVQKTINMLRDVQTRINRSSIEADVDSLLPQIDSTFTAMRTQAYKDSLRNFNFRALEDLHRDFVQINSRLQELKKMVVDRRDVLQPDAELIGETLERWTKTREQESKDEVPAQITERIQSLIKEIQKLQADIVGRQNSLLVQEDRVTTLILSVEEVFRDIDKKMMVERDQFLSIDSPPIWALLSKGEDSLSILAEFKVSLERQGAEIRYFKKDYKSNIRNHLLIFLGLFIFLLYFKYRVSQWSEEKKDAALDASIHVIRRPLAVALLISLLITPFFYPEAPRTAIRLIYLWSIIPIIYLVPALIRHIPKIYTYLFGILFLFSQTAFFAENYYILDRIALIVFDLVSVAILLYSLHPRSPLVGILRQRSMYFAITMLKITLVLFIVGVLSNILGNTFMSKVVSHGAFSIIFAGILLYIASSVIKSLISLFMYSDAANELFIVQKYPDDIQSGLYRLINYGAIVYWIYVTLNNFLIFEPLWQWILDALSKEWRFGETSITFGSVFAFILTLWLALFLSKVIRILLQDEILSRFEMKRGVPGAISMMVRIALITLGFVLAFSAAGINFSSIAIIFGALGVGIGFGLQNIFNNLISGIIIAFERPIQLGDIIQIATLNLMGEVREIGIRSSIIKTFEGAEVVVPNGNIISNEMINWTLSDRRRRQELFVGVKYGSDLKKVRDILNEIVTKQDHILKNPAPLILFIGFGDSSLNFRILFWTPFDVGLSTKSAVGLAIDEAFKAEGIEIPFPQRDLHLKSSSLDLEGVTGNKKENPPKIKDATSKKSSVTKPSKKDDTTMDAKG